MAAGRWVEAGDVAIATVRGVEGQLVWRVGDGLWRSLRGVRTDPLGRIIFDHLDDQVTVTSRAAIVTEADRDELIEHAVRWLTPSAEAAIREWFAAKLEGGA